MTQRAHLLVPQGVIVGKAVYEDDCGTIVLPLDERLQSLSCLHALTQEERDHASAARDFRKKSDTRINQGA